MILDSLLEFADATSVAAAAGTALIGDVIDLQEARDIGNGEPIYLVIQCDTSIITGGAAGTVKFQLASDAAAAIATDGSATVHYDTGTIVTGAAGGIGHDASLVLGRAGARLVLTTVHALEKSGGKLGLATMCVGVGQGLALAVERV